MVVCVYEKIMSNSGTALCCWTKPGWWFVGHIFGRDQLRRFHSSPCHKERIFNRCPLLGTDPCTYCNALCWRHWWLFPLTDKNARPHHAGVVNKYLEEKQLRGWIGQKKNNLTLIHAWDILLPTAKPTKHSLWCWNYICLKMFKDFPG